MTSTKTNLKEFRLGQDVVLGRELARGGEGSIHEIDTLSGLDAKKYVAKKYFKPSREKTAKLQAMLANVPQDPTYQNPSTLGHISIAWPQALIMDQQNKCLGFIMPYIDHKESFPLLRVYNPQDRRTIKVYDKQKRQEVLCEFTWQYLLRMAYNLAEAVRELHRKGYVVGDLDSSNILVTAEALITLVDCDSMQVRKPGYTDENPAYFRCPVGKPEYTPPELQGENFGLIDRYPNDDNFGLAVLFFLLLMEGRHPFAGTWLGNGPPPSIAQNIEQNNFPYIGSGQLQPPKKGLSLKILSPALQDLMVCCFAPQSLQTSQQMQSGERPTAEEWAVALEKAEAELTQCKHSSLHVYSGHLKGECPWCARISMGIPDPFPAVKGALQAEKKVLGRTKVRRKHLVPLPPKGQTKPKTMKQPLPTQAGVLARPQGGRIAASTLRVLQPRHAPLSIRDELLRLLRLIRPKFLGVIYALLLVVECIIVYSLVQSHYIKLTNILITILLLLIAPIVFILVVAVIIVLLPRVQRKNGEEVHKPSQQGPTDGKDHSQESHYPDEVEPH